MKMFRGQKGFTLVELTITLAVVGILSTGLVMIIFQTTRVNTEASAQITAFHDTTLIIRPLISDVKMAQTSSPGVGEAAEDSLIMDWTSWYDDSVIPAQLNPTDYRAEYTFLPAQGTVQRELWKHKRVVGSESYPGYWQSWVDANSPISTTTYGRRILDIRFSSGTISGGDSYIEVTITSSSDGTEDTAQSLTYHFSMTRKAEVPQT